MHNPSRRKAPMRADRIEVVRKGRKFKVIISDHVKGPLFQSVKEYDNRANAVQVAKAFSKRHDKRSFDVSVTKEFVSGSFTSPIRGTRFSQKDML
jgi:hypothetical protein